MTDRLERLEGLKYWYDERAKAFIGPRFTEMSMSVPGAAFVLETLEGMEKPARVAELGTGFSTAFVGSWLTNWSEYGGELWSMDHNPQWLSFVRVLAVDLGLPLERFLERDAFVKGAPRGVFDVVIVDHGPQMQTRADDMPWIAELLSDDGVLLFDDWRPRHEGRIRNALRKLGGGWSVTSADHTRRFPTDKAIGVVRRKR